MLYDKEFKNGSVCQKEFAAKSLNKAPLFL